MGEFDDLLDTENSISFDETKPAAAAELSLQKPTSTPTIEPVAPATPELADEPPAELTPGTSELTFEAESAPVAVVTTEQPPVVADESSDEQLASEPVDETVVTEPVVVAEAAVDVTPMDEPIRETTTPPEAALEPEAVVKSGPVGEPVALGPVDDLVIEHEPESATPVGTEPTTVTEPETVTVANQAVTLDAVPNEVAKMVADAGSTVGIANIDSIVQMSEADLAAEAIARQQAAAMKPILEKENRRQKLLAEKELNKIDGAVENINDNGGDNGEGDSGDGDDGIIEKSVAAIMHESMIPYSEFVILDRALPRVEDGLKPVQRRILYAMNDMGLTPDKPFRKSAAIVGECLGKYHPHGDTSVYDAMVRLAQPFNMNMPLVSGQGNFGSEDGDPPAAMRYTEAKLAPLALELMRDIEKDTVPYSLTYDDRNTEPDILPARFPNLLTNGTSGIAVGLATNIPPHNLGEVIDAHVAFIENNKISLKQVLKIIKGPDFPTAGWITSDDEMVRAYETGRGKVVMSGKVHIEVDGDKRNIVITELPYQVNKVQLQKNIADLRENKKGDLQNITEIRDESDRNGMRIIIKLKKDTDAHRIVEQLYKYTQLRCNFNFNMVAISDGKPKQMSLLQIIESYVNYQRQVIYKRSVFELNQAKERAHILEGLLVAIKNIDEVIKIIKTSKHTSEARERLQKRFNLSERQAQAILDLRLARLTNLEVLKVEEELAELKKLIERLTAIIGSKKLQFEVVKDELLAIKKRFKVDRRTKVVSKTEDVLVTADDDAVPVEDVVMAITAAGNIKRLAKKHFNMSNTAATSGMRENDINIVAVQTQTDKLLHIFTNLGKCYKLYGADVPECRLKDRGISLHKLFPSAGENERPIAIYPAVADALPEYDLVWLSKTGMIKRSKFNDACGVIKSVFDVYKIREDRQDEIVNVQRLPKERTILMISNVGNVLNATTGDVPVQGRIASGVKGMQLDDNAYLAGISTAENSGFAVMITNHGNAKKVAMKDIDKMVRYRKGLTIANNLAKGEEIVFAGFARAGEDIIVKTASDEILVQPLDKLPTTNRMGKMKNVFGKQEIVGGWVHRTNAVMAEC